MVNGTTTADYKFHKIHNAVRAAPYSVRCYSGPPRHIESRDNTLSSITWP